MVGEEPALRIEAPFDLRVLAFTAGVAAAVVLVSGLAPALRATRVELASALNAGTSRNSALRLAPHRAILVVQVAAALTLLFGAGLLARTLANLRHVDPGFGAENLLLMTLEMASRSDEPTVVASLVEKTLNRVQEVPGVQSVSVGANVLFGKGGWNKSVWPQGFPVNRSAGARFNTVGPAYFETAGVPVRFGREFEFRDRLAAPRVAVVNEAFVRSYWPNEKNPIGLRFGDSGAASVGKYEVVGVVRDTKVGSLREDARPVVYDCILQSGYAPYGLTLHVRTRGNPALLVPRLRGELRTLDDALLVHSVRTLEAAVTETLRQERMMAGLSSFFGLLALVLTAVGVYGIVSYTVERRTHEIGIRIALGARQQTVAWAVTCDALRAVFIGVVLGLPAALASTRVLESLLFGLAPGDSGTLLGAAALTLGVGALAAWLPARRATRLEPMIALRRQ